MSYTALASDEPFFLFFFFFFATLWQNENTLTIRVYYTFNAISHTQKNLVNWCVNWSQLPLEEKIKRKTEEIQGIRRKRFRVQGLGVQGAICSKSKVRTSKKNKIRTLGALVALEGKRPVKRGVGGVGPRHARVVNPCAQGFLTRQGLLPLQQYRARHISLLSGKRQQSQGRQGH